MSERQRLPALKGSNLADPHTIEIAVFSLRCGGRTSLNTY
ncbi:hypothetical protein BN903_103 [Halorubrum sp. AJ67]|nr:hypothetical protein BN903_103 [Halorubrum sp. AJ67]